MQQPGSELPTVHMECGQTHAASVILEWGCLVIETLQNCFPLALSVLTRIALPWQQMSLYYC